MSDKKINSKQFSLFFFANLFFSLIFSLMVFFLFIRLKTNENSSRDYFSRVLSNFQENFEDSIYNEYVLTWFKPNLKSDNQEKFSKYKLSILAKTINTFFKNILVDTQNNVITDNLHNFVAKKLYDLELLKKQIKQHILNNPDIKEVSTYDLKGSKIFGIKYKNSPDYEFSPEVISDLMESKNLLLKRGSDNNIILLSLVENAKKEPFMIVSQSIYHGFFDRILKHLEIENDVFYIKDSENFVLFDNQSYQQPPSTQSGFAYRVFDTLTKSEERNLSINLNNVSYSIGTIVKKNNVWGNVFALIFFLVIFVITFFFLDLLLGSIKNILATTPTPQTEPNNNATIEIREPLTKITTPAEVNHKETLQPQHSFSSQQIESESQKAFFSLDSKFPKKDHQERKPLTLEQYLLKEKNKL